MEVTLQGEGNTRKDSIKALDAVSDSLHKEFSGHGAVDRLAQLDAHLETCKMLVGHIFDEADRMEGYR